MQSFEERKRSREFIAFARKSVGAAKKDYFSAINLQDISYMLKIRAAFHRDGFRSHWLLVLRVQEDSLLAVYDPLFSNAGGEHVYQHVRKATSGDMTIITRDLTEELKRRGVNEGGFEEAVQRRKLYAGNYSLSLPNNFRKLKLQENSYDCGPLVLYAAIVANLRDQKIDAPLHSLWCSIFGCSKCSTH